MSKKLFVAAALMLVVCASVALSNGNGTAPAPKPKPAVTVFEGTSNKGSLEDALKSAIESAMASRKGTADAMVEWKIKDISGAQGGIAGVNRLTVTIEVKPQ